jgi:hypothetical protein
MRPRITNKLAEALDVYRFSFESAGALELDNEHSELAVEPAHYIRFAGLKHACPLALL